MLIEWNFLLFHANVKLMKIWCFKKLILTTFITNIVVLLCGESSCKKAVVKVKWTFRDHSVASINFLPWQCFVYTQRQLWFHVLSKFSENTRNSYYLSNQGNNSVLIVGLLIMFDFKQPALYQVKIIGIVNVKMLTCHLLLFFTFFHEGHSIREDRKCPSIPLTVCSGTFSICFLNFSLFCLLIIFLIFSLFSISRNKQKSLKRRKLEVLKMEF